MVGISHVMKPKWRRMQAGGRLDPANGADLDKSGVRVDSL
jgi:hypothetical protein